MVQDFGFAILRDLGHRVDRSPQSVVISRRWSHVQADPSVTSALSQSRIVAKLEGARDRVRRCASQGASQNGPRSCADAAERQKG